MKTETNAFTWNLFIKCADILSDGDLEGSELRYYEKEYKRLSRICCPEIKEVEKERRVEKRERTNEQMDKLIERIHCSCGGDLKQSRSGSWIAYCKECNKRYKAGSK